MPTIVPGIGISNIVQKDLGLSNVKDRTKLPCFSANEVGEGIQNVTEQGREEGEGNEKRDPLVLAPLI